MATMTTTVQPAMHFPVVPDRVDSPMQMDWEPAVDTHEALTVNEKLQYEASFVPRPALGDHEVLLRTKAVGLNPIDWKTLAFNFCMPSLPWINGRECSAIVEHTGRSVTSVRKGQRVWTSTYYKDRRAGCFQELVVAPEHTVVPLPDRLCFEEGACLGVGGLTAAMTMWKWFGVPLESRRVTRSARQSKYALIWGGSTITGQFLIQIAVQAGYTVIAVASRRTAPKVSRIEAHHVIVRDGKSVEEIGAEISEIGQDKIVLGVDLVGPQSATQGVQCLSKTRTAKFAPLAVPAPPIEAPSNVEIVNVEMKRFVLDPDSRQYAIRLSQLVESGIVQMPEVAVLPGGLKAVERGLVDLRSSNMGGQKLVVSMES